MLTNLDVRILHAQVVNVYTPVTPVINFTYVPLVTPSVFENEKIIDLSDLSFSFSKTDFVSLSGSLDKSNDLYSSSVNSIFEIRNTRRPSASGIIRADQPNPSVAYFLRQRFSFGSDLNRVTTDIYFGETLPVGRNLRLRPNWAGVAWVTESTKRFVYDGWNVIEEQTVAGTSKYYVWGLDLSQSLQGAGGIGGLLTMFDGVGSYAYLYDGNGNVGQMVNNIGGAIAAHYEYDPYGNTILSSGAQAVGNPYRFSTKYLDSEYNLYYYGFRYYDPLTGRWLSRDPIGEIGGIAIYTFISNSPVDRFDYLGLTVGSKIGQIIGKIVPGLLPRVTAIGISSTPIGQAIGVGIVVIGLVAEYNHYQELQGKDTETDGKKEHRGRFQAQGNCVNKSEPWAQNHPLTIVEAHKKLDALEDKLTPYERAQRTYGIQAARKWMDRVAAGGGIDAFVSLSFDEEDFAPKSKRNKIDKPSETRIDIEVRAGKAFVPIRK